MVTRGAGGDDALGARLRELGAEVLEFPAIALAPAEDLGPLDDALRGLGRFDWVAFASANAVEQAVARLDALGLPRGALADREAGLRRAGHRRAAGGAGARAGPDAGRGDRGGAGRVAGSPRARPGGAGAAGRRGAARALRRAARRRGRGGGARRLPDGDRPRPARWPALGALLAAGRVDAVTFASPSAVQGVVAGLGAEAARLSGVLLAAIGPTTAEALRAAGYTAGVMPGEHTAVALAEAVAARLAR